MSNLLKKKKSEFYIQWHFLEECNLRCEHCYQNSFSKEDIKIKKLDKIYLEISKTLKKWKKKGRIALTGGEPFLKFDKLLHILEKIENDNSFSWVGILTNGTLIDEKKIKELKKINKLKEIQVSIDGGTEKEHDITRGKGTFNKVIEGLKKLIDAGLPTSIMFTLTKINADSVVNIIELSDKLGVKALTIERYTPVDNTRDDPLYITAKELKKIYQIINQIRCKLKNTESTLKIRTTRPLWKLVDDSLGGYCPAGFSSLCIMNNGDVFPCRRLPINIGNVLKDGIFKIWYKSDVLWKLRNKDLLIGKCNNCKYLGSCGGCRAVAYALEGDFMASDPQCWL